MPVIFRRLTVSRFLAVTTLAETVTPKYAGNYSAVMRYAGNFSAVKGFSFSGSKQFLVFWQ